MLPLILLPLALCQTSKDLATHPVTIPHALEFDLRSKAGLDYRIFVAAPSGEAPESGWPVIYLTDGNSQFPIILAACRQRGQMTPRAIVVGIGYPGDDGNAHNHRRGFDLTPSATVPPPEGFPNYPSGGNDQFLTFIQQELKPIIEGRYRVDTHRQTLSGHSFGGLFVLHVLLSAPGSFQTYLAASPSFWFNNGSILEEARAFRKAREAEPVSARLFLSTGTLETALPSSRGPAARTPEAVRARASVSGRDLAGLLKSPPIDGLTVEYVEFPDFDHGTSIFPSASRGVRFALDGK